MHAYVLMTNHVHLLMTPQTAQGINKVMQSVGRYYVQYLIISTNAPARFGKADTTRPCLIPKLIY